MAEPAPLALPGLPAGFAFRWGAVTLFGADLAQQEAALALLRPRLANPLDRPVEEAAALVIGAEDGIDPDGLVSLREFSPPRLALVADALAKSAALAHQEATLAETLDRMDPVIASLRSRGRLAISQRLLLRGIGTALSARSRATARVQASDKPDLLWDHPELERLYARLADEFELTERSEALDRKLALIGETVQTLLSLIESRRSLVLEVAIIVLIAIEAATALYGAFLR